MPSKRKCMNKLPLPHPLRQRIADNEDFIYGEGSLAQLCLDLICCRMAGHPELHSHIPRWISLDKSTLLGEFYKTVRMSLGDYSASPLLVAYRKKAGRIIESVFEASLMSAQSLPSDVIRVREFLTILESRCINTLSVSSARDMLDVIQILSECRLVCVRFAAVFLGICIVVFLNRTGYFIPECQELFEVLSQRRKDCNEAIRRMTSVDGICRIASESGQGLVSREAYSLTLTEVLRDCSRLNRLQALTFIQDRLKSECVFFRGCVESVGAVVASRCFDSDSAVACASIQLLSCSVAGELLLGSSESNYQRISNLIWRNESCLELPKTKKTKRDPLVISREALKFIDTHILAPPGIFSPAGSDDKKLAMVLEFVDQYSDGFVAQLNGHLVATVFSVFKVNNERNFFKNPEAFNIVVDDSLASLESQVASQHQQMEAFMKLNTVLEVLLSVIRLLPDEELGSFMGGGVGRALLDIATVFGETCDMSSMTNRRNFDAIALDIAEDVEARQSERETLPCSMDARLSQAIHNFNKFNHPEDA